MLPHISANEIGLATCVVGLTTALVNLFALFKKSQNQRT